MEGEWLKQATGLGMWFIYWCPYGRKCSPAYSYYLPVCPHLRIEDGIAGGSNAGRT